ncbi:hypothetical protein ACFC4C_31335 [Streptomyces sp. NPDC056039]|uniref:hypothetical protein n=1 Tax=Streptomyces sp. NPDC056039 TaxID=3345687 RepID=UPI0035DCB608
MHGRAESDTDPEIADSEPAAVQKADQDEEREPDDEPDGADRPDDADADDDDDDLDDDDDPDDDDDLDDEDVRRARWTAAGTGALLTLAGLAAALLRLTRPALVPAAYACGALVCAGAAALGYRGRTRRALWLLIAGTMVMALGDQFD